MCFRETIPHLVSVRSNNVSVNENRSSLPLLCDCVRDKRQIETEIQRGDAHVDTNPGLGLINGPDLAPFLVATPRFVDGVSERSNNNFLALIKKNCLKTGAN